MPCMNCGTALLIAMASNDEKEGFSLENAAPIMNFRYIFVIISHPLGKWGKGGKFYFVFVC